MGDQKQPRETLPPTDDRTFIGSGDETEVRADMTLLPPGKLGGGHEWVGRQLGRYRLVGLLGGGGMGVVYRGRDEVIERDVAIKVLPPNLEGDAVARERFLAEARSAGKLSHPNTVALYEIGEQEGTHYLAMELVDGGSLQEEVRRIGPLSPVAATKAIIDAARGLSAAHSAGMVHRDIKPANLLRAADGHVKVCDFGLAKGALVDQGLTKQGHVLGTPYYMSPEQCEAKPVDARSDVYSLGATYYYLLTGNDPYADAGSTVQVMFAHCQGDPLDPQQLNPLVPEDCARIVLKATAKDPGQRYSSAGEMLRDLEAAVAKFTGGVSGVRIHSGLASAVTASSEARRRRSRWMLLLPAGLAAVGLVAIAAFWFRGEKNDSGEAGDRSGTLAAVTAGEGGSAAAAVPTGEPIKVGVLHSLSGTMVDSEAPVVDAVLLAIDEVNRAGGVLGRPLQPVVADGRSDPAIFLREATRLIDEEHVSVVFGCWTSASRKTVVPLFEERDHLLVYPVQFEGLEESPNVLYTGTIPNQQILPAVRWAIETLGAKRFFFVGSDYVFPRSAAAIVKDAVGELGAEVVGEAFLPLGSRDTTQVAAEIAAQRPDVILNAINGDTNVAFFPSLRAAGIKASEIPTISFSIGEQELRHFEAAEIAGDYAAWNYFQEIDSPENAAFVAAFRQRYGPQRLVTDPMQSAFIGVKLWAKAAQEAGSVVPARVRPALRNLRMAAPEGAVRVDPSTQHLYNTPRIGRVGNDGRFEIVWTAELPVAPEPYPASRSAAEWKAFLHDLQRQWGGAWSAPAP